MGAMTMPFNVRDEWVFEAAEPEASISATLVVRGVESWIEDVVVRKSAAAGAAPTRASSKTVGKYLNKFLMTMVSPHG